MGSYTVQDTKIHSSNKASFSYLHDETRKEKKVRTHRGHFFFF